MNVNNPRRLLAAATPKQSSGLVADEDSAFSDAAMPSASQSKAKRQTVKSACANCQKRKVKCSGERPICALCRSRGQTCAYDAEAGVTRIEALRRRNQELTEQNADYQLVFRALQTGSEEDAINHLARLRIASDIDSYAQLLKQDRAVNKRRKSTLEASPLETTTSSNQSQGSPQDYEASMNGAAETPPHSASRTTFEQRRPSHPAMTGNPAPSQSLRFRHSASASSYPSATDAETWPFQTPNGHFPDGTPTAGPQNPSLLTKDWAGSLDGAQRMIDPRLTGLQTGLEASHQQQEDPAVDGKDLAWQSWGYWPPPGNLQM